MEHPTSPIDAYVKTSAPFHFFNKYFLTKFINWVIAVITTDFKLLTLLAIIYTCWLESLLLGA